MSTTDSNLRHEYQPGTPSLLRALNERTLLEYLRSHQPTSRAQLARATGLSKPTVSQALASLENAGLVRAVGQSISSKGGRIAILYEPNPDAGYVVGVDVGRGWVRAAVANLASHIFARNDMRNDAQSASELVALINRLAQAIVAITAVLDPELIVLGGGIGQRGELLLPPLERRLQQLTTLKPRIVVSKLGDDCVLLGSIATALEVAHNLVFQYYVNR